MPSNRTTTSSAMLLLVACLALAAAARGQHINSFAGPFDVELRWLEPCPTALSGLSLFNYTQRLTRDRKYPKRFYYTGVMQHAVDILSTMGASIRLSSWSARGGWKENAYHHKFPRVCDLVRSMASSAVLRNMRESLGSDFNFTCPFPASRWEFSDFPVDLSTGNFKEFLYGKWRIDLQAYDGDTVLGCYREYVDTVPRVPGRGQPPAANYTGTIRISKIKSMYP